MSSNDPVDYGDADQGIDLAMDVLDYFNEHYCNGQINESVHHISDTNKKSIMSLQVCSIFSWIMKN